MTLLSGGTKIHDNMIVFQQEEQDGSFKYLCLKCTTSLRYLDPIQLAHIIFFGLGLFRKPPGFLQLSWSKSVLSTKTSKKNLEPTLKNSGLRRKISFEKETCFGARSVYNFQ